MIAQHHCAECDTPASAQYAGKTARMYWNRQLRFPLLAEMLSPTGRAVKYRPGASQRLCWGAELCPNRQAELSSNITIRTVTSGHASTNYLQQHISCMRGLSITSRLSYQLLQRLESPKRNRFELHRPCRWLSGYVNTFDKHSMTLFLPAGYNLRRAARIKSSGVVS